MPVSIQTGLRSIVTILTILAAGSISPPPAMAVAGSSPALSMTCGQGNSRGTIACRLSGRDFAPNQSLRVTYTLQSCTRPGQRGQVYRRTARTDATGSFSRPPIVLAHSASCGPGFPSGAWDFGLLVSAQDPSDRYPVRITLGARDGQILSWSCGGASAVGRALCRLAGSGFLPSETLTIAYSGTFGVGGRFHHPFSRRTLRATAQGAFSAPAVGVTFTRNYLFFIYVNHGPVAAQDRVIANVVVGAGRLGAAGG